MTRLDVHLRGVVRAGTGQRPLTDARVTLLDAVGNVVRTATTGSDGTYAFTDLDAGPRGQGAWGDPHSRLPPQVGETAASSAR